MSNVIKAMEVAEACKESMMSFDVMMAGAELFKEAGIQPTDEVLSLMFKYSGILASNVATRVTSVWLSENEIDSMMEQIQEFEQIEKDVLGE